MKLTIKLNDRLRNLEKLKNMKLSVGWFEDTRYNDNTQVAQVAQWQEYGTSRGIPQRPFMRPAQMNNEENWKKIFAYGLKKGWSSDQIMKTLGLQVQGDIQKAISNVFEPPLKPATIKARMRRRADKKTVGNLTKPLIDTGVMFGSVSYRIEE